jgi:hypothetical protein
LGLLCGACFAIGLVRLWPAYDAAAQFPQHPEAIHLARSLAFHGEFANPFRLAETGPSAYLSPAFPAFLALLLRAFGTGAEANFAFRLAAGAALAAELALLPLLSEAFGLGFCPGLLAWAMGLLPPLLTFPDWEASYAGLLIVVAIILWLIVWKNPPRAWTWSALLGVACGTLLLTSATAFPVIVAGFLCLAWNFPAGRARKNWLPALVITVVMLVPWTWRNYAVFHRFIPFRTALGLALAASNNDCASAGVRQSESTGCFQQQSPNHNPEQAQQARLLGEVEYSSAKLRVTFAWIQQHPARFAVLTLQRIAAFWFPYETESPLRELTIPGSRRKERLMIYLATILSVLGMVQLARTNPTAFWALAGWLILFPPIYYIALYEDRYRYPILWATLLAAACPLCRWGSWVVRRR